jgi:hypothetical protein
MQWFCHSEFILESRIFSMLYHLEILKRVQDDYMKARALVITISPGTINGESRNRRHAYAYDSI